MHVTSYIKFATEKRKTLHETVQTLQKFHTHALETWEKVALC